MLPVRLDSLGNDVRWYKPSEKLHLYVIENFLKPGEAEALKQQAEPSLEPSKMHDLDTGAVYLSTTRTSHTSVVPTELFTDVRKRAAELVSRTVGHVEAIAVIRYQKGQFFKDHHDFHTESMLASGSFKGGQRIATVLAYLSDLTPEDGGATVFPEINFKYVPKKNSAIFWLNVRPEDKSPNPLTLHASEPLLTDNEKWAANIIVVDTDGS